MLVCPKCQEIFKIEFPLDLEGQITEFKCPVCNSSGEADLQYRGVEEIEQLEENFTEIKEENIGEEYEVTEYV